MASVVGGCENFEAGVHLTAASIKQNCGSRDNGSAASSSQCMGMVASRGCLNFFLLKLRRNPTFILHVRSAQNDSRSLVDVSGSFEWLRLALWLLE